MTVTVVITTPEIDLLKGAFPDQLDGYFFQYNVYDGKKILAALDEEHEAYQRFSSRLAEVAIQLGVPDAVFGRPKPEPVVPAEKPAEVVVSDLATIVDAKDKDTSYALGKKNRA